MVLRNRTGLTQGLTHPAGPSVVLSNVYWNLSEKRLWYAKLNNNSVAKGLMETWIQIPHPHQYVGERSNSECLQLQLVKHGKGLRHGLKLHFRQWCQRSCKNWCKYKCRKEPLDLNPPCFSIWKVSDWQELHFSALQWFQIQCEWLEKHLMENSESLIGHPNPYRNIIEIVCDYLDKKMEQEEANIQKRALNFPYDAWRSVLGDYLKKWNFTQRSSGCAVLTPLSILTTYKFPMLNIPISICHASTNYY